VIGSCVSGRSARGRRERVAAVAARGIPVHGVYPAGIDTDVVAGIDTPKNGADLVERPEGVRARVLRRCRGLTGKRPYGRCPGSSTIAVTMRIAVAVSPALISPVALPAFSGLIVVSRVTVPLWPRKS
jgi:hypothetical protein